MAQQVGLTANQTYLNKIVKLKMKWKNIITVKYREKDKNDVRIWQ